MIYIVGFFGLYKASMCGQNMDIVRGNMVFILFIYLLTNTYTIKYLHYLLKKKIFALYFLLLFYEKYISPLYYILGLESTILRASYTTNSVGL